MASGRKRYESEIPKSTASMCNLYLFIKFPEMEVTEVSDTANRRLFFRVSH